MKSAARAGLEVRVRAAQVLHRTLASRRPVTALIDKARAITPPRDRGLLDELVLGSLRWLRRLDSVLARASGRSIPQGGTRGPRSSVIDSDLLAPLRVAVYQLLFLDRVPPHAAVNAAVETVKRYSHLGAAGFVNAVLRKVAKQPTLEAWPVPDADPLEVLATELSYPTFLVARWLECFGEERARRALAAGNRKPGYQLLCFGSREGAADALRAEGVETRPAALSRVGLEVIEGDPRATEAFRSGLLYVQDQSSQAAALLPEPMPGERVLDVAAAPGGKCFSLLAAEPSLRLWACDSSLPRMMRLRANQRRLGVEFPIAVARGQLRSLRPGFDRVVVDLPCSGTGTFARHPELKWRVSETELARLARQGLEIISGSADLVEPGGLLCVVTCSVEQEENEDVVARFLEVRRDFRAEELAPASGQVAFIEAPGRWRALPGEDYDGFTVHALRREHER